MSERRKILELFDNQKEQTEKRVSEGIEKYRKGDMQLTITDNDGNPIPNVLVKVNQIDHEFRFGANLFMLDEMENKEKTNVNFGGIYFSIDLFGCLKKNYYLCNE